MTKTLTCLDMIAAKIMNKYKKIQKMSNNDKNIDILNMIAAKKMKNNKNTKKYNK